MAAGQGNIRGAGRVNIRGDNANIKYALLSPFSLGGCLPLLPATPSTSREANFDIRFGFGIDELGALFEAAELCGVVERKGSYYYFGSDKLSQVRLGVVTAGATVTF